MRFRIIPIAVASFCLLAGITASVSALSVSADLGSGWDGSAIIPVTPSEEASSLSSNVQHDVSSEASLAMKELAQQEYKRSALESSSFARGNGIVQGQGVFWDGAGPRSIRMYLDAYGAGPLPVASFPFDFTSTGQKQPITASIRDYPAFQRFAFRFSHDGVEIDLNDPGESNLAVSSISPAAMLFHSDYGELASLLKDAGFMKSDSTEPDAMLGAMRRFRAANKLSGPDYVSIGDLFAVRRILGRSPGKTSLVPYVEWATAVGGAREKKQADFVEPSEVTVDPATKPPAVGDNIYSDMEPPAEEDRGQAQ